MKNKRVLNIAFFSLIIFIAIASYLWYLYFHDYENRIIAENPKTEFVRGVELVNTGGINYIITINEENVKDGCSKSTRFSRDELEYELKLDNKVIKKEGLDKISNNILDTNTIKGNSINDYSLKIRLKSGITDYEEKHFHYVINLEESK